LRKDRLRDKMLNDIAMYLLEKGKPLTELEYRKAGTVPVRLATVNKFFGRWCNVLNYIKHDLPDVWAQITAPPKPVAPKVQSKPKTYSTKVMTPKVSVKKEIEDEKNL